MSCKHKIVVCIAILIIYGHNHLHRHHHQNHPQDHDGGAPPVGGSMGPAGADSEVLAKSPGRDPGHDRDDNPDGDDDHGDPDHLKDQGNAFRHSFK